MKDMWQIIHNCTKNEQLLTLPIILSCKVARDCASNAESNRIYVHQDCQLVLHRSPNTGQVESDDYLGYVTGEKAEVSLKLDIDQ